MSGFNLIDQPWIPCTFLDGSTRELGLRETLVRAREIREIADAAPPVTVTLHRLLLAVLHRTLGPVDGDAWADLRERGAVDPAALDPYLDRWRDRFDLFAAERPFFQDPRIALDDAPSVTKLTFDLASPGNAALLFDHTLDGSLTPAEAARVLVAHQAYAVGGTVAFQKGEDPRRYKYAKAGPLNRGATVLVTGQTLFATLVLNLVVYDGVDQPFPDQHDDAPAWERDLPTPPCGERVPAGYLDLLTWQNRRVRLDPSVDAAGSLAVRRAVTMKGEQFPDGWHRLGHETMLAFRKNPRAKPTEDPWPPVAFREDRALWRDSLALFGSIAEETASALTVANLHEQVLFGRVSPGTALPMDLYGIATDQAKVLFWRHERLPLPLASVGVPTFLDALRQALDLTEQVGLLFARGYGRPPGATWKKDGPRPLQVLAEALLPSVGDRADRALIQGVVDQLAPGRAYWSRLEAPFTAFVVALAADRLDVDGVTVYGQQAVPHWTVTVERVARAAFQEATDGLGDTTRALRARALGERAFGFWLRQILAPWRPREEEADVVVAAR